MAIELVSAFFSVIVDHSIAPMRRLFGYVFNYKSNMEKLKKQLDKLTDMKMRVQNSVDAATRNGEEIEQDVQKWLTRVNKFSVDARKIITEGEERGQLECFKGLRCPNPKSRHGLSRKVAEEAKNLSELLEVRFDKVSFCPPPQGMGITSVKGYQAFESRKRTLDGVMEGLRDPNVNMIGVYGMGGVGKTTLVKEVAQNTKQENLFDTVVMAEVSQNPDIKKIQGIIADKLGLEFREESLPGRADRLCDRLKKERMILIILDDIWEKLDLKEVGILLGDDHKVGVCKILLTSRDEDVLSCGMDTQKNFLVGVLQEEEAWDLFKEKAGKSVESPDLRPTAFEVAKKCACLPIAIVTVATALKNKSLSEWKNALRELQRPSARSSTGIRDDVYGPIELSYNTLESEELKFTFLFCGCNLFIDISYLLRCGMGLGVFKGVKTMEEARDRVHTLLHNLEASCLLLDCSTSNELITMHDVIRDVAISIASRDHHVFARNNEVIGPKDWPDTNMLKNCTAICLHINDISELPEEIECPALNFFYIYDKDHSLKIPNNFFRGMREVRVLDLSGMLMSSLPPSFNLLANLRTLCLDQCLLGDIALVGELKKLEILTLLSSDVEQLPKEFGQLTQLKLLDLSNCTKLKVIPPGVLSSLSQLEELHMFNSFDQWEDEGPNDQRSNASLAELKPLAHLTTLQIHVRDARLMPKNLFFEKLERYRILIGDEWVWSGTFRTLKLKHITSDRLEDGILMLLKKTEDLYLDELKGVENALCKLDREGFPLLKHLHVQNSPEIRYIINLLVRLNAFPLLESLFLHNLINLEKICHGKLTSKSFSKLRKIKVGSCGRLRHLFSFSLAKNLLKLQEIEVLDCENMTAIVSEEIQEGIADDEATEKIELSQLRSLTLQCLLMLISFHYNENTPSTSQSRRFMPLFNQKTIMFPGLEALKLSSINIGKIWQEQLSEMPSSFRNLGSLVLEGCDCLEYVFSSSMAQTLVQLKHLEICECEMMQEIVVTTKFGAEERKDMMLFPKLTFLKMKDLQNLTSFCSEENMEFSSLKQLHIENCPKLTAFVVKSKSPDFISSKELKDMNVEQTCTSTEFLFNEKVTFPMLEEVTILHMDNLKNIWHNQLSVDSFWKLKRVQVENCKKLSIVFPACVARGLMQLEKLIIESCGVEYIVAKEEAVEAATETEFLFPRVSFLRLWKLPELKSFYPGIHSSEWPMLKTLDVYHCDKLKVFATDSRSSQGTLRDLQLDIPTQQPLFFVEKVIPNLELLTLNSEDIKMIDQHGEFPSYLFCKLKFLELECFHDKSAVVPLGFLQRFQNLEKLSLVCSYFEELFSYETLEGEEKHAEIFTWIRNLRLNGLYSLKHIWKQDCRWEVVFQSLETLEVWYCDSLITLAPSSASLQNLTTLDVWKCTRLINLVTSSTAKSLMQLKIMKIRECHRVTEIVSHNEVDETEEIIFTKLEDLILDKLSSLSSFCSVNYTFKFPSLEMVVVSQCPKLKIFSHGVLSTPLLHRVWLTEEMDEGRWERDLNGTIQLLFTKMDEIRNLLDPLRVSKIGANIAC